MCQNLNVQLCHQKVEKGNKLILNCGDNIPAHSIKAHGWSTGNAAHIGTRNGWSASCPDRAAWYPLNRKQLDHSASMGCCCCQESNHDSLVIWPTALSLYQLPYPVSRMMMMMWLGIKIHSFLEMENLF